MTNWRPAFCIELYDAQVVIRPKDNDASGFSEYDFPGYRLGGDNVAKVLRTLGFRPQPIRNEWMEVKGQQKHILENLQEDDLHIARQMVWYSDLFGCDVTELEAYVTAPGQLEIRLTGRLSGVSYSTEHTYCGRFAVEWVPESVEQNGGDNVSPPA